MDVILSDCDKLSHDSFDETAVLELQTYIESGFRNLLVVGDCNEALLCVSEYIHRNHDKYSRIFKAQYDKDKCLDTSMSIDCVLKKCLSRELIKYSPPCKNYLDEFENNLCNDTLVVVYDYNVPSISPYMRHLASCDAVFVVISECDMKNLPDSFKKVYVQCNSDGESLIRKISDLSQEQNELLMTLSAMLHYLGEHTKIVSSERGVFDRKSVEFYLGSISCHLDELCDMGFVKEACNGKITVDDRVIRDVLENLSPSLENCKTFKRFLDRFTDFYVIQDTKDLLAKFYTSRDGDFSIVGTAELFDVYTRFCLTDEKAGLRLYNMFMALILQKLGDANNEHLLMRNTGYFLNILRNSLKGSLAEKIYDDELYISDECPSCYSLGIRANLDIIRICVSLIRGVTSDLYQENALVLDILYQAMKDVFQEISDCREDESEKCHMLDDVLRICHESFSYFSVFDKYGDYKKERDDVNSSVVRYSGCKHSDGRNAVSLAFGYSKITVLLYGMFQRYIFEWLKLCDKNEPLNGNRLLESIHKEKLEERTEMFENISVHYCRIRDGLDNFCDYFDNKRRSVCVFEEVLDDAFEKQLKNNRNLLVRGFDNGTKTGAERYAEKVMSEIRASKNPKRLFRMVLSSEYPVSDYFYKCLIEKKFVRLVLTNIDVSERAKADILLFLVYTYNDNSGKPWKNRLVREIIAALYIGVAHTDAFLERMYGCASSMYLVNKTYDFSENDTFVDSFYEKIAKQFEGKNTYSHEYIAKSLYEYLKYSVKPKNKKKLENAFESAFFEYNTRDSVINFEGFAEIAKLLLGENNGIDKLVDKYVKNIPDKNIKNL